MATDEKNIRQPDKAKPADAKKPRKKKVAKWFREMRSELKKVVWPTRKQVVNNTLIVLLIMVVSGVVVWGLDEIASRAAHLLMAIGA